MLRLCLLQRLYHLMVPIGLYKGRIRRYCSGLFVNKNQVDLGNGGLIPSADILALDGRIEGPCESLIGTGPRQV